MNLASPHEVLPQKDEDAEHSIASAWRPVIREIVKALSEGDWTISRGIASVVPPSAETAKQMREYVESYGEPLVALSDDTWRSSVAQWIDPHWDVIVDLWAAPSGCSDMILELDVAETAGGFRFELYMIYVP